MTRYRRQFGRWLNRISGGFGSPRPEAAAAGDSIQLANKAWAICFVVSLMLSVALTLLLSPLMAQMLMAVLWGAFVGLTLLLFLPQKILLTLVGGIMGVSLANVSDVVKIVSDLTSAVSQASKTLNEFFGGNVTLYNGPILIFFLLVILCCLPAYKGQDV